MYMITSAGFKLFHYSVGNPLLQLFELISEIIESFN